MKKRRPGSKPVWAYAYQMVPPQPEERLSRIKDLLDQENVEAQRGARSWRAKVVIEEQITHILVVTDSPEQNGEVNQKLEAALTELNAGFSVTSPMAVEDDRTLLPPSNGSSRADG